VRQKEQIICDSVAAKILNGEQALADRVIDHQLREVIYGGFGH